MLTSGDVVELDLGSPAGREAGFRHPAIVVTAQRVLDAEPSVVQVVPLTSTLRGFSSEERSMPMMRMVSSRCRLLSASIFERWRRGGSNEREAMLGRPCWGRSGSCLGSFSMSLGEAKGIYSILARGTAVEFH